LVRFAQFTLPVNVDSDTYGGNLVQLEFSGENITKSLGKAH
jgi:hypothetical protein